MTKHLWTIEPPPPIPYRPLVEPSASLAPIRILAVALCLDAGAGLVSHLMGRTSNSLYAFFMFLRGQGLGAALSGGMTNLSIQMLLVLITVLADVLLLIAAAGCLRGSNVARKMTIGFCWLKVVLVVVESSTTIMMLALRYGSLPNRWIVWGAFLPQSLATAITQSLLPAATAIILALPATAKVFRTASE